MPQQYSDHPPYREEPLRLKGPRGDRRKDSGGAEAETPAASSPRHRRPKGALRPEFGWHHEAQALVPMLRDGSIFFSIPRKLTFSGSLQAAAAHSLRSHVCGLRSVFVDVHAAAKNDLKSFALRANPNISHFAFCISHSIHIRRPQLWPK